jgi:hypothetical protein
VASVHFWQLFVVCAVSPHWLSRFCVLAAQGYASTLRLGTGQHTMRRADLITLTRLHHRKCGLRQSCPSIGELRLVRETCAAKISWVHSFRIKLSGRVIHRIRKPPRIHVFQSDVRTGISFARGMLAIFRTSLLSATRLLHLI